jgi:hypothetical protein
MRFRQGALLGVAISWGLIMVLLEVVIFFRDVAGFSSWMIPSTIKLGHDLIFRSLREPFGELSIDLFEEVREFGHPVTLVTSADDEPRGDIKCGKQRGRTL